MKKYILFLFVISFTVSIAQNNTSEQLFINKEDGYHLFRIPTIIACPSGKLLAFAEGRKNIKDNGDIDLVMKSSTDQGKTWSALQVIWDDGASTCGNPSPVYDALSESVLVLATKNNNQVFVLRSRNEGGHWSVAKEITQAVKLPEWNWYATGPVHAIQLQSIAYKNSIVVPCNHTVGEKGKHISHVIISDDGGETWHLGGSVDVENTDESTVIELNTGQLLLNMRNGDSSKSNRKISLSSDGGMSWTSPIFDNYLIEPICQGALLNMDDMILFSNPHHTKKRKNLSIQVSLDNGNSWWKQVPVQAKKAAYSDMVVLDKNQVGIVYETGKFWPYGGISFSVIEIK